MDQHPVPQNISSYEFHLVGDMTLKQFFQVAGGIVVGLIIYRTNLPFFVKYPLGFFAVLIGIMLAFVPVGGRPFSQWLLAFIKAVYSPTQYLWSPNVVTNTPSVSPPNLGGEVSGGTKKPASPLDKFEDQLFDRFSNIFKGQTVPVVATTPPVSAPVPSPVAPTPAPIAETPIQVPVTAPAPPPILPNSIHKETMVSTMTQVAPTAPTQTATMAVPANNPVIIPNTPLPVNFGDEAPVTVSYTPRPTIQRTPEQAKLARFASNMPTPTVPNILYGQISDLDGQPVEGVIVEIAEAATDIPVRALRTNRLGQFQIATPLPTGDYVLHFEKDNYKVESVTIQAKGAIITPIQLVASKI